MNILLVCIVKMENLYLRDFVEYYKRIGVSKILLFDNNDENGEYPQQVIGDYISDGYVMYRNARGKYRYQLEAYDSAYEEYKTEYDWLGFIDIDEYLEISDGRNLPEFLSDEKFADADVIPFYWLAFGDDGKLHYENKPVYDRFFIPVKNPYENDKNTFKLFIRGDERINLNFTDANAVNYNVYKSDFNIVMTNGAKVGPLEMYGRFSYDGAYLKHYQTLTIDEFLCRRFGRRSYADNASTFSKEKVMGIFSTICEITPEKQEIIDRFFENYEIKEDISPDDAKIINTDC